MGLELRECEGVRSRRVLRGVCVRASCLTANRLGPRTLARLEVDVVVPPRARVRSLHPACAAILGIVGRARGQPVHTRHPWAGPGGGRRPGVSRPRDDVSRPPVPARSARPRAPRGPHVGAAAPSRQLLSARRPAALERARGGRGRRSLRAVHGGGSGRSVVGAAGRATPNEGPGRRLRPRGLTTKRGDLQHGVTSSPRPDAASTRTREPTKATRRGSRRGTR